MEGSEIKLAEFEGAGSHDISEILIRERSWRCEAYVAE